MALTYRQAVRYLDSFANFEVRRDPEAMRAIRPERMRRLMQRFGDPQRRFRSVLVAGTNGKGSICAMLYAMLRESPLRCGLYTSPHLENVRERIRVWPPASAQASRSPLIGAAPSPSDTGPESSPTSGPRRHGDDWIEEAELAALVSEFQPQLEEMRHGPAESAPTYFEVLTALALVHFSRRSVEVAVLEAGLGGRLDATNVVDAAVAVIGPIGVDHEEILGSDPVTIAKEKAGIIKANQTVIASAQTPEVEEVLRSAACAKGAPFFVCGRDITVSLRRHSLEGSELLITGTRGIYDAIRLPLVGRHQAQNVAAAVGALEALAITGIPYTLVERGLSQTEWPGRLEIVSRSPLVIMDGAHNPQAASALREALEELCSERAIHLLIGMSKDKDVEGVGRFLGPLAATITCTRSRHPRALEPDKLAHRLAPFCPQVHAVAEASDAYTYLLNTIPRTEAIVVAGSLFLIGELRGALRQSHVRAKRSSKPKAAAASPFSP